jgi:hypothetical protein
MGAGVYDDAQPVPKFSATPVAPSRIASAELDSER